MWPLRIWLPAEGVSPAGCVALVAIEGVVAGYWAGGGGCCGYDVFDMGCCCGYGEKEEAEVGGEPCVKLGAEPGMGPGAMNCAPTFGSLRSLWVFQVDGEVVCD